MSDDIKDKIDLIAEESITKISKSKNLNELEDLRIFYLGKKGLVTSFLKTMKGLEQSEKINTGKKLNLLKNKLINNIEEKKLQLNDSLIQKKLLEEKIDITLENDHEQYGTLHPLSKTIDEISAIFANMGFYIEEGPDIETDYYNFTALNIPLEHPARQEHDTFYLQPNSEGTRKVLRTHTSPVQIRTLEKIDIDQEKEIRVIVPGRTYRSDHDATHSPMFHQCEGLVIGENINMSHLKGTLIEFLKVYFNSNNLSVRFRPSFFPFTEPSAEVDIGYKKLSDGTLDIGQGDSWLEVLGSGMVHPKVLEGVGIDPSKYQGFAFGMGLERLTMLKYNIPDLRPFYDSDLRWLKHYGFLGINEINLHSGLNGVFSWNLLFLG